PGTDAVGQLASVRTPDVRPVRFQECRRAARQPASAPVEPAGDPAGWWCRRRWGWPERTVIATRPADLECSDEQPAHRRCIATGRLRCAWSPGRDGSDELMLTNDQADKLQLMLSTTGWNEVMRPALENRVRLTIQALILPAGKRVEEDRDDEALRAR